MEEVKPLLHDEIRFHNENCTIRFNDDDEEEEEEIGIPFSPPFHQNDQSRIDSTNHHQTKSMIRTTDLSPGEIFSSILDKYDGKPGGCL